MRKSGKQRAYRDVFLRLGARERAGIAIGDSRWNRMVCFCAGRMVVAEAPKALWINDHNSFYFAERTRETGRQYKNEYLYVYAFEENSSSKKYLKECIARPGGHC